MVGSVFGTVSPTRLESGTTKNNQGREFPFGQIPQLVELLEAQRDYTRGVERERREIVRWVFHRSGRRYKDFRKSWATACSAAGLPGAWFHDLRRTTILNFERAGVSRTVAMSFSGDKTESVYRRYAIVDEDAQQEWD